MKQMLERHDLDGLTEKQKDNIRILWYPQIGNMYIKNYNDIIYLVTKENINYLNLYSALPLLTIGQMIEIVGLRSLARILDNNIIELCDALWDMTKEVLNTIKLKGEW